jgi:hypothetical protein
MTAGSAKPATAGLASHNVVVPAVVADCDLQSIRASPFRRAPFQLRSDARVTKTNSGCGGASPDAPPPHPRRSEKFARPSTVQHDRPPTQVQPNSPTPPRTRKPRTPRPGTPRPGARPARRPRVRVVTAVGIAALAASTHRPAVVTREWRPGSGDPAVVTTCRGPVAAHRRPGPRQSVARALGRFSWLYQRTHSAISRSISRNPDQFRPRPPGLNTRSCAAQSWTPPTHCPARPRSSRSTPGFPPRRVPE